jgi:aryl-alcohol dehydrogenase-like predicted oxidoreductase
VQYANLGSTDLRVSRLSLGTVFRHEADESVYRATIDAALEAGCNFFDTSNVYHDSESERILGRAMRGRRGRFVVTTKVGAPEVDEPSAQGLTRGNILRCCEKSLKRLGIETIDLYLCHFPDPLTPIDETIAAMDALVRQGKVRYVGCSNFEAQRLDAALLTSKRHGQARFVCNQLGYSLLDRRIEDELIPCCQRQDVGITVFAATAIGLLSGNYRYGQPPPPGSSWRRGPYNFRVAMTRHVGRIIDAVVATAERYGRTPTQVAIAWCLSRAPMNSVIIGCDSPERVRENFQAADWVLPDDDFQRLNEVSDGPWLEVRKDCPEGYDAQIEQRQRDELTARSA